MKIFMIYLMTQIDDATIFLNLTVSYSENIISNYNCYQIIFYFSKICIRTWKHFVSTMWASC